MSSIWAWRRWSLNTDQLPWAPLPSSALSHVTLASSSLKRSKSALWKSRVASLLCTLFDALRILNSIISWSLQPTLPSSFMLLTSPPLVGEDKVPFNTFSHGFLYHLEEEIINTFQEPLWLLVPWCTNNMSEILKEKATLMYNNLDLKINTSDTL